MPRIPDNIIEQITAVARPAVHSLPRGGGDGIAVDFALGVVHEWIASETVEVNRSQWAAPHGVLLALAWKMLHADDASQNSTSAERVIVWIGRRVWPSPRAMLSVDGSRALLARSIFVDPAADRSRSALSNQLWAVQQSLTCDAVMVVIWDASGFDLTASRRTQLAAARASERPQVLALAVRPWHERHTLSSAATRWVVRPHAAEESADSMILSRTDHAPHWQAELVRARGALGSHVGSCAFVVGATWSWSGG